MTGQLVFLWLILGMITTSTAWSLMRDELEMALGEEDEKQQPALRMLLTVVGILIWPVLVLELTRRR